MRIGSPPESQCGKPPPRRGRTRDATRPTPRRVRRNPFSGSSGSSGAQGSGVAATQARELAPFSRVELAGSNNIEIRVGAAQAVSVHADDNLLGHVTTKVHSGSLMVGNTPGSFSAKSPMTVEISVPSLETLTLSGSGNIAAGGIKSPRLVVALAAAASSTPAVSHHGSTSASAARAPRGSMTSSHGTYGRR